jgi:hypothetical protein
VDDPSNACNGDGRSQASGSGPDSVTHTPPSNQGTGIEKSDEKLTRAEPNGVYAASSSVATHGAQVGVDVDSHETPEKQQKRRRITSKSQESSQAAVSSVEEGKAFRFLLEHI